MVKRPSAYIAIVGLVGLALLVLLAKVFNTEVVREGQLFDFTSATVQQVRINDGIDVYVIPEVTPTVDLINGLLLFGLAGVGLLAAAARASAGATRDAWMFGLLAVGAAFLSLDEIIGIHDTIGANLRFLADVPGINSPDDPVFVALGVIGLIYFWVYRATILASRSAARWIVAGLVLFAITAALDTLDSIMDENLIELVSTLCLLFGFTLLSLDRLQVASAPVASRRSSAPSPRRGS